MSYYTVISMGTRKYSKFIVSQDLPCGRADRAARPWSDDRSPEGDLIGLGSNPGHLKVGMGFAILVFI